MAFEGLFIEIMKLSLKPEIDYKKSIQVGKTLNLDKESVMMVPFGSNCTII